MIEYDLSKVDLTKKTVFSLESADGHIFSIVRDLDVQMDKQIPYKLVIDGNESSACFTPKMMNEISDALNGIREKLIPVNYDTAMYLMMERGAVVNLYEHPMAEKYNGWRVVRWGDRLPLEYVSTRGSFSYRHDVKFPYDKKDDLWCVIPRFNVNC